MRHRPPPSMDDLKRRYTYDPETGLFTFNIDIGTRGRKGRVAGGLRKDGYVGITLKSGIYLAHQLAWYYHYEQWVPRIDHKDRKKANNRINNLREATAAQNIANSTGWSHKRRKYKFPKGVYLDPTKSKKPFAAIKVNGKLKMLGYFDTPEEAAVVYQEESRKMHGEFSAFRKKV